MTSNVLRRLDLVELRFPKPPGCRHCAGSRQRVVIIDALDNVISESLPATGCPVCGAIPFRTVTVVDDGWRAE